jgi:hypothetical protein
MAAPKSPYPVEMKMSEKVTARVGFQDDRLQLGVRTGVFVYPEVTLSITPEDLPKIEQVVQAWKAWLAKPKIERELMGAKP